jgi:osmotically-inducible protein OsmY
LTTSRLTREMCWNNEYVEVSVSTPRDVVPKLALGCLVAALCVACGPSEEDIKRDVRTRFDTNQTIAPLALSIEVKRQVVYLSGKTGTPAEQQQAMALAKEAKGVKLVVNDMWLNNRSLADKVKDALGQDAVVGKIPIDVEAQGGLIRLSSDQTNREERERIVKIASSVEGVKEVEDRMR